MTNPDTTITEIIKTFPEYFNFKTKEESKLAVLNYLFLNPKSVAVWHENQCKISYIENVGTDTIIYFEKYSYLPLVDTFVYGDKYTKAKRSVNMMDDEILFNEVYLNPIFEHPFIMTESSLINNIPDYVYMEWLKLLNFLIEKTKKYWETPELFSNNPYLKTMMEFYGESVYEEIIKDYIEIQLTYLNKASENIEKKYMLLEHI